MWRRSKASGFALMRYPQIYHAIKFLQNHIPFSINWALDSSWGAKKVKLHNCQSSHLGVLGQRKDTLLERNLAKYKSIDTMNIIAMKIGQTAQGWTCCRIRSVEAGRGGLNDIYSYEYCPSRQEKMRKEEVPWTCQLRWNSDGIDSRRLQRTKVVPFSSLVGMKTLVG